MDLWWPGTSLIPLMTSLSGNHVPWGTAAMDESSGTCSKGEAEMEQCPRLNLMQSSPSFCGGLTDAWDFTVYNNSVAVELLDLGTALPENLSFTKFVKCFFRIISWHMVLIPSLKL